MIDGHGRVPSIRHLIAACVLTASARTFDDARAAFEEAWHRLLPEITKKDFVEHRRYRALEAWKSAMWNAGCRLPTQVTDGLSCCFCGATIDIKNVDHHVYAAHLMPHERDVS